MSKNKEVKALRFYKGFSEEHVYKTDLSHTGWLILKFFIYGCMGMVLEIFFTNFARMASLVPGIGKIVGSFVNMSFPAGIPNPMPFPWRFMFAYSSLWMILVYGSGIYSIEILYFYLKKLSIFLRAACYAVAVMLIEFIWGWIFRLILGDFIWRYDYGLITTTPSILPYWLFAGVAAEFVVKKMSEKDLEYAFRTNYEIPLPLLLKKTVTRKK